MKVTRLQMPDGTLVRIEGNEAGADEYITNHYKKQHRAEQQEAPAAPLVTNFGPEVLPLPVLNFDPPGAASQKPAPVPAFVGNEEPLLPLPAMTF